MAEQVQVFSRGSHENDSYLEGDDFKPNDYNASH